LQYFLVQPKKLIKDSHLMFRYIQLLLVIPVFLICTKIAVASHVDVMLPSNAILTGSIIFELTKYHPFPEKHCDIKIPLKIQLTNYKFNKWIDRITTTCRNGLGNTKRYSNEWKLKLEFLPSGKIINGNMSTKWTIYSLSGTVERLQGKQKNHEKASWNVFIDFLNPDYDANISYHYKQEKINKDQEENKIIRLENKVKNLEAQTIKEKGGSPEADQNIPTKEYSFKRKVCESAQASEGLKAGFMQSISKDELSKFLKSGQDCSIF